MDLARYVVDAVVVEHRSVREVARAHGVSKSWVAVLVSRYRVGGYGALEPRSKRPHRSPARTEALTEDEIVRLRKHLLDQGLDAGPHTIRWHLQRTWFEAPSAATIWRILVRRGFVTPEPKKRPHASFIRFEAQLPNECWQADVTHWQLADGTDVEILDFIDDHSRLIVAADARRVTKAHDVLATFATATERWGAPASMLTDNGAIFNANSRRGRTVFQDELERLGIVYKHSRPYHPQTCGKIERFHDTLKRRLASRPPARSLAQLQRQIDCFIDIYNFERPHKSKGRRTPHEAFMAREHARPGDPVASSHFRVRTDVVDAYGRVTLRHDSRLLHIGIGRRHSGLRIRLYVADLDVRIVTLDGEILRHLELDPSRDYQGQDRELG
jgi:transposase InsO family protein